MNHEGRGVLTTLLLAGMLILGTGVPTCHAQAATSVVVFPDANFFTLFGGLDISVAQDFVTNAWHVLVLEAFFVLPLDLISIELQPAVGSVELLVTLANAQAKADLESNVASTGFCVPHPVQNLKLCTSGDHVPIREEPTGTGGGDDDDDDDDEFLEATTDSPLNATTAPPTTTATDGGGGGGDDGFHIGSLNPVQTYLVLGAVGLAVIAVLIIVIANRIQRKHPSYPTKRMLEARMASTKEALPDDAEDEGNSSGGSSSHAHGAVATSRPVAIARGSAFSKVNNNDNNNKGARNKRGGWNTRRQHPRHPSTEPLMQRSSDVLGMQPLDDLEEDMDEVFVGSGSSYSSSSGSSGSSGGGAGGNGAQLQSTSFAVAVREHAGHEHRPGGRPLMIIANDGMSEHGYDSASYVQSGQSDYASITESSTDGNSFRHEPHYSYASESTQILKVQKRLSSVNLERQRRASFHQSAIYTANAPSFGPQPPPLRQAQQNTAPPPPP